MPKIGTALTGACGEHYVASYLSGHGLIVALPRAGVKGSDLFVAHPDSGSPLRVQVKTGQNASNKDKKGAYFVWDTSFKVVDNTDDSLWFAYVHLNGWPENSALSPEVFFVPSKLVIEHMKTEYKSESPRTFFWLYEEVATIYRGTDGLKAMLVAMNPEKLA